MSITFTLSNSGFIALIAFIAFLLIGFGWITATPFAAFVHLIPPELLKAIVHWLVS